MGDCTVTGCARMHTVTSNQIVMLSAVTIPTSFVDRRKLVSTRKYSVLATSTTTFAM